MSLDFVVKAKQIKETFLKKNLVWAVLKLFFFLSKIAKKKFEGKRCKNNYTIYLLKFE